MSAMAESNATIMIVEDDPDVARTIEHMLSSFGFKTVWCHNGAELFRRLGATAPDLCIIDLGLPDMDGIEVMRRVRASHQCGILILTGRSHVSDKVMGLELGADDYVIKPFEPRELVARIRSILRRRETAEQIGEQPSLAEFSGWRFNIANNTLTDLEGKEQLLSNSEAELLKVFLARPNRILQRELLLGSRDYSQTDRNIDVRVSRLRRRFEVDDGSIDLIKTIYGAGYLFATTVAWQQC